MSFVVFFSRFYKIFRTFYLLSLRILFFFVLVLLFTLLILIEWKHIIFIRSQTRINHSNPPLLLFPFFPLEFQNLSLFSRFHLRFLLLLHLLPQHSCLSVLVEFNHPDQPDKSDNPGYSGSSCANSRTTPGSGDITCRFSVTCINVFRAHDGVPYPGYVRYQG